MNYAWQVTEEDVMNLFEGKNLPLSFEDAGKALASLTEDDHYRITEAALNGHTMEDQTKYAQLILGEIFIEKGGTSLA